ncbi:MAG: DUF5365 family protein [Bacillota bacterium]|nr:DUF5365 family protein [Bacillota bacterium]
MKIVFASTPSQEEEISVLIQYFYSNIFPLYFNDTEIMKFQRLKVLYASEGQFQHFDTLREAFHVMSCLQIMIFILESNIPQEHYEFLFNKNAATLKEFGFYFPFDYIHFLHAKDLKNDSFSVYTSAANEMLI